MWVDIVTLGHIKLELALAVTFNLVVLHTHSPGNRQHSSWNKVVFWVFSSWQLNGSAQAKSNSSFMARFDSSNIKFEPFGSTRLEQYEIWAFGLCPARAPSLFKNNKLELLFLHICWRSTIVSMLIIFLPPLSLKSWLIQTRGIQTVNVLSCLGETSGMGMVRSCQAGKITTVNQSNKYRQTSLHKVWRSFQVLQQLFVVF